MRALPFLALFLLLSFQFAYLDPPIKEVADYNNALAPSLMHFNVNYGGVPETTPSFDNPVGFYDVEILGAMPSVSGVVSSNHPPVILWAWGENHGSSFQKTVPGDPHCSDTTVDRVVGEPVPLDFTATFQAGPKVMETDLLSGGFANPALDPFSSGDLKLPPYFDETANRTLFPTLNVTVYGEVGFPVVDTWLFDDYKCVPSCGKSGCTESCSCQTRTETDHSTISASAAANRSFTLGGGNVSSFLALPALGEQADLHPAAVLFTFTDLEMYKYYVLADGKLLNSSYQYSFNVSQDAYGARHIVAVPWNATGPQADDADLPGLSGIGNSMAWAVNQTFETPLPLFGWNETYGFVDALELNYSGRLGKSEFEFRLYDWFHDAHSDFENITTRRPVSLVLSETREGNYTERIMVMLVDRLGNRLAGQEVEVSIDGAPWRTFMTNASGEAGDSATLAPGSHALGAVFNGSDAYTSASDQVSAYFASPSALNLDAFGSILALLAVFAGIAYAASGRVPGAGFIAGAKRLLGFLPAGKLAKPRFRNNMVNLGSVGFGNETGKGEEKSATEGGTGNAAGEEKTDKQKDAVKPVEGKQDAGERFKGDARG
jgi:hypothetical protein